MSPIPSADARHHFEAARARLAAAAKTSEAARLALFASREGLKCAERAGRPTREHVASVHARTEAARSALAEFARVRDSFHHHTDPRDAVPMLDDATPLLLFPLRIETRFGTTMIEDAERNQLWVRVYPDDCLVDSFEPLPSETEIASAQRYWTQVWQARGIEALERAAWRAFVASHGSGRAAWLEAHYRPSNAAARPNDPAPDAFVLVIPTEAPVTAGEADALEVFWSAVWRADRGRVAIDAATAAFRDRIQDDARAQELIDRYAPANLTDPPSRAMDRAAVRVSVAFVEFPPSASQPTSVRSWTQAARSFLLPERLVLRTYADDGSVHEELGHPIPWPLVVGPDPQAPESEQIRQENGEVVVGDDLKWLTDFDRAVDIGMGFRVDLTPATASGGFARLVVLGVRVSADAGEGKQLLEDLLIHHRDGTSGFAVLKQGTPTNNTEGESSGFTTTDEADRTFDERLHPGTPLRADAPWHEKRDGEWLAEALGIDVSILDTVGGSRNTDQREAQAMNIALWPATLGYSLETMMHPLFEMTQIERVRRFYERFVTGRGLLPAIRLGRQPYGILPTTALSRRQLPKEKDPILSGLETVLTAMAADWARMSADVSRVGKTGDSHQLLLDILGLHPSSVEHYQRYAESIDDLYNRMRFFGWGEDFERIWTALLYEPTGMAHLRHLGFAGEGVPDILKRLFLGSANLLSGPFVDDVPLSESSQLQKVTAEPWNYIEWLRHAAGTSLDILRQETGFAAGRTPRALLYLMLRHALLQAYWDSSIRLGETAGVFDAVVAKAARQESPYVSVQSNAAMLESRWAFLYSRDANVTGDPAARITDHITAHIGVEPAASELQRMLGALDVLQHLPTSRLERLFAEHLDTCTYRLDAWQQGFVHHALASCRYTSEGSTIGARKGVWLGAFGWLEEIRPRPRTLTRVPTQPGLDPSFYTRVPAPGTPDPHHPPTPIPPMPGDAAAVVHPPATPIPQPVLPVQPPQADGHHGHPHPGARPRPLPPLMHDSSNGGYIHAPSLNQAVAAAVLRNGYLANATPAHPDAFAVNLSSRRVRTALSFLEGIREGQSLGALLGYQFERALHDSWALGEVDEHIHALRRKFPLAADRDPDTAAAATDPIETIEASNVIDGLQLVEYVKNRTPRSYPFGFSDLPPGSDGRGAAIDAQVERLLDTVDALADLRIAESVYQAVQSNYDAVAATLESSGNGQLPVAPAVVETPRSGRTVTHRVALHFEADLDEDVSPSPGIAVTPRARIEPAVNRWLAERFPAADRVACTVRWFDVATNALRTQTVTQRDLALQPIDLLYALSLDSEQAMSELDDRILRHAHTTFVTRADAPVTILYRASVPGAVTFFELAPLVRSLRPLLLHSRPLRPTDAAAQGSASSGMDAAVRIKLARVTKVQDALVTLRDDLIAFRDTLEVQHTAPIDEAAVRAALDAQLTQLASLLERATRFGLGDAAWGFIFEFKRTWFSSALEEMRRVEARFTTRLDECDRLLAAYDIAQAGWTERERIRALATVERLVRATNTGPHADAIAYRASVGTSRGVYLARLVQVRAALASVTQNTATLRATLRALIDGPPPMSDLDAESLDSTRLDKALVAASADLLARAKRLVTIIQDARLTPAGDLITRHNASADPAARAQLLVDAAKKLLGEDVLLLPEFTLDAEKGAAFQAAFDAGAAGAPLEWQRTVKRTPEPVDTWLYGIARVRDKMRAWETSIMLVGAFGSAEPDLTPIQIPWKAGEHWLGLEYPAVYAPDGDRLCYTAHFARPFDRTQSQCGLLVDEWTEVIPAPQETTGLTFHFDRPSAEAPQALLLVTPPVFTGSWQWEDIVAAVTETLDRAKSRAVEPAQVDRTLYARFLPFTTMAATLYQVSIMTNLARNNDYFVHLTSTDG